MIRVKNATPTLGLAIFALTALVALICGLFGCESRPKPTGPQEKVTIACSTASNAVLVYIAFAKEYFAEEGLEATPQLHPFGKIALNSLLAGNADLATVATTPVMFAIMGGKDITTLASIQTSTRNEAIVARQDLGIAKSADLKGKKIGVTFGTTADYFLDSFLLVNGIDKEQVTLIDMKPEEMLVALGEGRVDAVSTFNPTLKHLKKSLGSNGVVFYGEDFYTEIFCLAANRGYVNKHPGAIKKVLRALIKAEAFAQQHPEEARSLAAEFTKTDKAILVDIWGVFSFRVSLDQALLVDFEEQTRWAIKNKLTTRRDMPNYIDYIDVDSLAAVKPEAVRIVR